MKKLAPPKARELRAKLQALAERGVNGEKEAAKIKLRRLERRFDFSKANDGGTDIFAGVFIPSPGQSSPVMQFEQADFDIANAVKWAIEKATGIRCGYREGQLIANSTCDTANKLHGIAATIAANFGRLWGQFKAAPGTNPEDRHNFILGLYEGMMDEERSGELLPRRATVDKVKRTKKQAVATPAGLSLHPYAVAAKLGKQVRFSMAIDQIAGELDATIRGELPDQESEAA